MKCDYQNTLEKGYEIYWTYEVKRYLITRLSGFTGTGLSKAFFVVLSRLYRIESATLIESNDDESYYQNGYIFVFMWFQV